jgi:hypothetical protein
MATVGKELAEEPGLIGLIKHVMAEHSERNGCRFREGALARIVAGIEGLVEAEEICSPPYGTGFEQRVEAVAAVVDGRAEPWPRPGRVEEV